MEDLMNVASYIYNRYLCEYGMPIDEMKLHKLMYFAQRESFIQNNKPLFDAVFYGWKYGPVLKEIREAYRENSFYNNTPQKIICNAIQIMDKVFGEYASKDSWSLSRLTHGELSWKNSRIGIAEGANSDNVIDVEDIKKDADRIRERREKLSQLGFVLKDCYK